ncbi:MAG: type II toxin-antitoxin system ParD family antitoxin [Terriglobia bacterium]
MTSFNISMPKALKQYIEEQVAGGTYSTPSEFVRELIREDQKRRTKEEIEAALLQGLRSGPAVEIDATYWARRRKELRERHRPARAAR